MTHLLGKKLSGLWRDSVGGILIYAAITAPVVIGAAGLSIDIGLWYANKRLVQSAVDSAALAGALELRRSEGNLTSITNVVNADALINGYRKEKSRVVIGFPSTSNRKVMNYASNAFNRDESRLILQGWFNQGDA